MNSKEKYNNIKEELNDYVNKRLSKDNSKSFRETVDVIKHVNEDDELHPLNDFMYEWRENKPRTILYKLGLLANEAWMCGLLTDEEYEKCLCC